MNAERLEEVLGALGSLLLRRGRRHELVACGGGGLMLLGVIKRPTRDLDVLALVEGGHYSKARPLPADLAEASRDVGEAFGIGGDWLIPGPTDLLDLGLPSGFEERVETRRYSNLVLHLAGRADQICFKMYAAADQGPRSKHFADRRQLGPGRDESLAAARWAMTHDPSPGFRWELSQTLRLLDVRMSMSEFSARLKDRSLELAWSLWAELGVSGWERHHSNLAIDVEPLILFTAALCYTDPRLRDEALDWCIRYGELVSVSRLQNLLAGGFGDFRQSFGPFAATVNAHARHRWPDATTAHPYQPTGRSRLADLRRPALVQLRLRALLGVSARAEVFRLLFADPRRAASAADLTNDACYVKRSVADALENLRVGGFLEALRVRNQLRYKLTRTDALIGAFGPLPPVFPSWQAAFLVLNELIHYGERVEDAPLEVAAAEARPTIRRMLPYLRVLGVDDPPEAFGADLTPQFERWALSLADAMAGGHPAGQSAGVIPTVGNAPSELTA